MVAAPTAGSGFGGFHGCSSTNGLNCELAFPYGGGENYSFEVQATFTITVPPPPGTNTVRIYNFSTSRQAYLLGPGETAGLENLVEPGHERLVNIPSAVGTPSTFRSILPPATEVATVTCLVTASAWQAGTLPAVKFFDNEGYYLACDNGLVAP